MLGIIVILLVWVALPTFVYHVIRAASGLVLLAIMAAAASVVVAIAGLERGFRWCKALLNRRRKIRP